MLILPLYDRHQSTIQTTCVGLCADTSSVWPSPINYPDHLCRSMCWYFLCMTVTNQLSRPLVSAYVLILPLYDRHQSTIQTTCVGLCADTSSVGPSPITCVGLCADTSSVWSSPINYPDHLCRPMCWYFLCRTVTNQLSRPLVSAYVLILPLYDLHQSTIQTTCVGLCADTSSVGPSPINYPDHLCRSMCCYFLCRIVTNQIPWPFVSNLRADTSYVWLILIL